MSAINSKELDTIKRHLLIEGYIRTHRGKYIVKEISILCLMYFDCDSIGQYIESLKKGNMISEIEVQHLCSKLKEILMEESNMVRINIKKDKLIVVGDVKAQFCDLKYCIFEQYGYPNDTKQSPKYLFLGNYTGRGQYHTLTILLLLSLKARYPSNILLLRGRYESRRMTNVYGFYGDVITIFGSINVWRLICNVFDYLPLCSLINDQIFCVSGGLSPSINTFDQIALLDRFQDIPSEGPMCDLCWSSPFDSNNSAWDTNPRGAGYLFSKIVTNKFCDANNIKLIIRSSKLIMNGCQYQFDKKLLNICSAPNFAYRCGNKAAIAVIDEYSNVNTITFVAAPDNEKKSYNLAIPDYFL